MTKIKAPAAPRLITPRRIALATVAGISVTHSYGVQDMFVGKAYAETASKAEAGEGGEAGEAGVVLSEGPAGFLTKLGYFEGTYRIAASLYLSGARDGAKAHLEESHHAFYEDIEESLAKYKAIGFAREAEVFLAAVNEDKGNVAVTEAYDALMTAIDGNIISASPSGYDRLMSVHELIKLAAAEYEGGVTEGAVDIVIEYRDSWGFYETARARAERLARGTDVSLAKAGADVLAQLEGVEALYPSLTSDTAAVDASQLSVAAGWAEIIALRLK
jgi:hypothetical protein